MTGSMEADQTVGADAFGGPDVAATDDVPATGEGALVTEAEPASPLSDERVALGHALQSRADEVGRLVDQRFSEDLKGHAFVAARLATHLIGRWLSTDQVASTEDEEILAAQGELALTEDAALDSVAKAYFAWRDLVS